MDKRFSHIVTEEDVREERSLLDIMKEYFSFSSRLRKKIKSNQGILLNDQVVPGWVLPKAGDLVSFRLPKMENHIAAEDIPIDVIYEDLDLLIVNKAAGLVVHPTKGHPNHTLAGGIIKYIQDSGQDFKLRFINRLDYDTSGLVLVAKNPFIQEEFNKLMKKNLIKKQYTALVAGCIEAEQGCIDLPIARSQVEGDIRRVVCRNGYPSITHFRVQQRLSGASLLDIDLITGRTHQIRVHMSHIGHPILQDELYGRLEKDLPIKRQALHARGLSFPHPMTGKQIHVEADPAQDIKDLIKYLTKNK